MDEYDRRDARLTWVVMVFLLIAAAVCLLYPWPADSHEAPTGWKYPWACCSNMDCRATKAGEVTERPEGYRIESTGEIVAYQDKRVKDSPDGMTHWCAHQAGIDAGQTICLFVPPKGF
jgi:hypothetical protein